MRLIDDYTIPTNFIKLDDRVTNNDSFADTASIQKARQNHNKLIAERIKRTVLAHQHFKDNANASEIIYTITPFYSATRPPIWASGTILVTQWTQQLQFNFYAAHVIGAPEDDPQFGVRLWLPGQSGDMHSIDDGDLQTVTVNNAALAWFTITISLPPWFFRQPAVIGGAVPVGFTVYALCAPEMGGAVVAGAAISDTGKNWVNMAGGGAVIPYQHCFHTNNSARPPSLVIGNTTVGGVDRIYVDPPFGTMVTTAETATIRNINGIHIESFSICELPITDFGAVTGAVV